MATSKTSKGRIRHLALSVPDRWSAAEFYKETLGMTGLGETDGKLAEGVFLTDGIINLALFKFKDDAAAQGTRKDFVGVPIWASGWTTRSSQESKPTLPAPPGSGATRTISAVTK